MDTLDSATSTLGQSISQSISTETNGANTHGTSNGTLTGAVNGHPNGHSSDLNSSHTNGHVNGHVNGHQNGHTNGVNGNGVAHSPNPSLPQKDSPVPIAICGMALRLPGGLESPQDLWDFLLAKGDARSRVPESRYNISAYHSDSGRPGTIATQYGYFLDDNVKLGSLDAARFSLSRAELEFADPQQRRMLEVVREAFDDAGEIDFKVSASHKDWVEVLVTESRVGLLAAIWAAMARTGSRCKTEIINSLE